MKTINAGIMRAGLICFAILLGIIALFGPITERGSTYLISSGLPPTHRAFTDEARSALRTWLTLQGFASEGLKKLPEYNRQSNQFLGEWYSGRHAGSPRFQVVIVSSKQDLAEFRAEVRWKFHGFERKINASEAKVEAFERKLADWWAEYQRRHLPQALVGSSAGG